jgi:DNA-binding NtrC family response regulator
MNAILKGHCILVVEDQPLVMLDIVDSLTTAGASVLSAATLEQALGLAQHPHLSAAVFDFLLLDGDSSTLCTHLTERGVPFVVYTGYDDVHDACRAGVLVQKPALPQTLVMTLSQLLKQE